jgi:hypothetical protein
LCSSHSSHVACDHRNLGNDEHEKDEVGDVVTTFLNALGAFVIDDYVPWLSFTTKSWRSKVEDFAIVLETVTTKVFELEQHRQRAIQRQSHAEGADSEYVPDFVDMLLTESLEDGKPLTDKHLVLTLTVRIYGVHPCVLRSPDVGKNLNKVVDVPKSNTNILWIPYT